MPRRDLWLPDWRTELIEVYGQEWPDVLVEKWERNELGELRYITSVIYIAPDSARRKEKP